MNEATWQLRSASISSSGCPDWLRRTSVLRQGAVPVILCEIQRTPVAESSMGESTETVPHVLVAVASGCLTGGGAAPQWYASSISIKALGGPLPGGRRQVLQIVGHHPCRADNPEALQQVLDSLQGKIDLAVDKASRISKIYSEAGRRLAGISGQREQCAARDGYEAACNALGTTPIPDDEISNSYGIRYGHFAFPEYEPEYVARMTLASYRLLALDAERKRQEAEAAARSQPSGNTPVERCGQLWEPCENCGKEPVYLPLHRCDSCWPG